MYTLYLYSNTENRSTKDPELKNRPVSKQTHIMSMQGWENYLYLQITKYPQIFHFLHTKLGPATEI